MTDENHHDGAKISYEVFNRRKCTGEDIRAATYDNPYVYFYNPGPIEIYDPTYHILSGNPGDGKTICINPVE